MQKTKTKVPSIIEEIKSENDIPTQMNSNNKNNIVEEFDEYSELEKVLEKQRLYSQKTNVKTTEEILENYIKETNIEESNDFTKLDTNQFSNVAYKKENLEGKWLFKL
jgi:hypothetical protein